MMKLERPLDLASTSSLINEIRDRFRPVHAIVTLLAFAIASCASMRPYPGDDALSLTDRDFQRATRDQTLTKVHELFDHLQVPAEVRGRYGYMTGARFLKEDKYFETVDLSETILVAMQSVRIGFAKNSVIISGGDVDIAHASGVVVLSRGSIRVSHGQSLGGVPGMFVTAGSATIGWATGASVYAVTGAEFSQTSAVTAYNTDIRGNLYGIVNKHTRAAIFQGEPERAPDPPSMTVSTGETMSFTGTRCAAAVPLERLADRLPVLARREMNCPRIAATTVQCQADGKAPNEATRERWSFQGCGRSVHFDVNWSSHTVSISPPVRGADSAAGDSGKASAIGAPASPGLATRIVSPGDSQKIAQYFQEALAYSIRGKIVKARAAYAKAFDLDPDHGAAKHNVADLDSRIARADAAAAPYSARIAKGDSTSRTLADRGLAYFNAGDVGRGLQDLDNASSASVADLTIAVDRAWAYLRANRLSEASGMATQLLARHPRFAKAYEVRAWGHLLENRMQEAYKDAFSSLVEGQVWVPTSFASEKAAYRLIVGYFALRHGTTRSEATAWLREWRAQISERNWPDAAVLYLMGEFDEHEMMAVAERLRSTDRGNAAAEAYVFAALERGFTGEWEEGRRRMNEMFRERYSAGFTLARLIWSRSNTPGESLRFRSQSR
jgi:tetratricopeptide (TPR) repeat protein